MHPTTDSTLPKLSIATARPSVAVWLQTNVEQVLLEYLQQQYRPAHRMRRRTHLFLPISVKMSALAKQAPVKIITD
jgi:hypothetical protein